MLSVGGLVGDLATRVAKVMVNKRAAAGQQLRLPAKVLPVQHLPKQSLAEGPVVQEIVRYIYFAGDKLIHLS